MDRLASVELNILAIAAYRLHGIAHQMHLDSLFSFVVPGFVAETAFIELGIEYFVETAENVQIEACGNAAGIVIGRV